MTDVAVIKDPANVVVTSTFVTNALDPSGIYDAQGNLLGVDTYNAAHSTYKGALADPDNIGLFSDGLGHIALKILVPDSATENYLNANSWYTVAWKVKVDDGQGGTLLVEGSERFKVAPAGTLIFEDTVITPADVTVGISTTMEPEQISDLVSQVVDNWFTGEVVARSSKTITAPLTYLGPNGKEAVIKKTRSEIFTFDVGAGVVVKSVREGPDQVTYGDRDRLIAKWDAEAERALKLYLREVLGYGKPYVSGVVTPLNPQIFSPFELVVS